MSSEILVAKLKQILKEVYGLTDQGDEAKSRTADLLKRAISSLIINRKQGSVITASERNYEDEAVRYLFERVPDLEKGDQDGEAWFGLYLDIIQEDEKQTDEFLSLPRPAKHKLLRNRAAIIEDRNGEVTGTFYPHHEDAVDEWESHISNDEPELTIQAKQKQPTLF